MSRPCSPTRAAPNTNRSRPDCRPPSRFLSEHVNDIIASPEMQLAFPGKLTRVGLELPEGLSFDDWSAVGQTLKNVEESRLWWVGDWLNYGEAGYGETYSQAVEVSGYGYGTTANAKWVSGRIEISRRRESLSWAHHYEVAALEPDDAQF